jgi:hypothetical protein
MLGRLVISVDTPLILDLFAETVEPMIPRNAMTATASPVTVAQTFVWWNEDRLNSLKTTPGRASSDRFKFVVLVFVTPSNYRSVSSKVARAGSPSARFKVIPKEVSKVKTAKQLS